MAALQSAASAATSLHPRLRRKSFETNYYRNPLPLISCSSSSLPIKPTRRKNYLRQKILKTLKQPIIPPIETEIPIDSPTVHEIEEPIAIQETQESDRSLKNEEVENFEKSKEAEGLVTTEGNVSEHIGPLDRNSILKYGLWLIGAFIFHTVCAVWVFSSTDNENKNGNSRGHGENTVIEIGGNGEGRSRGKIILNKNGNGKTGLQNSGFDSVVYVDELEMEKKIEEIRIMAREAREKERLKSEKKSFDSDEEDDEKHPKTGIELEVENRLSKLRKKLENERKTMPVSLIGDPRTEIDKLGENESNKGLQFQKKHKFKGFSAQSMEKPNGFGVRVNDSAERESQERGDKLINGPSGNNINEVVGLEDGGNPAVHAFKEDKEKDMLLMTESTTKAREVVKERGAWNRGKGKGNSPKGKNERLAPGAQSVKPRKSNDAVALNKGKGTGDTKLTVGSTAETEFWWLNLPYVLAILMRRGNSGEGGAGLYTLKSISSSEDVISYTVAFEDRTDATNFCYLLQSFFEDLEDFEAEVVPLTVQELSEARKSRAIVVKRGQLRLYAGQPLADAEMELRALL